MGKKEKKNKVKKQKQNTEDIEKNSIEKKLMKLESGINKRRQKMLRLTAKLAAMPVNDTSLMDNRGNSVMLSSLFGDHKDMIFVHNMGRNCSYCTMWADGFNGIFSHILKRAAFILVSPDPADVQAEFAQSRGWKFPMYSAAGTELVKELGFQSESGDYWPGASVLHRNEDGSLVRVNKTFFGPGDFFCSVWHFFDMIPGQDDEKAEKKDKKKKKVK